MNFRPSRSALFSSRHDASIDAALRNYAHADPRPGLEGRVAARLASARRRSGVRFSFAESGPLLLLRRISVGALATAAGAAIVVSSVQHSSVRTLPPQALRAGRTGGMTPASVVHIPTHAMPQRANIDPNAHRPAPHGRANISGNPAHRATGAVVPRSPYPPGEPDSDNTKPQQ
jgi:hypothetical protein